MPHQLDGVRIDPPWSPPSAIGTSPAATSAALPPDEPPALWATLCGLRITPLAQVWLPAGKQKTSQGGVIAEGASRVEDPLHHGGIDLRHIPFEQRRSVHHGNAGDADVVLDRDLLAGQQTVAAGMDIRLPVPGA